MRDYDLDYLQMRCEKMFDYLQTPTPPIQNEDAIFQRIMELGQMLALSGEFKSAAIYRVDEITHGEIAKAIDTALSDKISVSMANQYVKTACKDWNYLVNAFDRINSAAAKMLMVIQTLISYEKEKMKML